MGSANRWSYKAGERGRNRVRAFERNGRGLYLEWWERDSDSGKKRRRRRSLGDASRDEAKRKADTLAARFAEMNPDHEKRLTVGGLFDIYRSARESEVSKGRFRTYGRVAEAMKRFFGEDRRVASLNRGDWDRYTRARRSGEIDARGHHIANEEDRKPVGGRTVAKDLGTLREAARWAVGADLLETDPTEGYPLPEKGTPRRPTISSSRYAAMLEVADDVGWRFKVALILAHETGHRSKSIRHLRWSDVDLDARRVRWRGGEDKMRHDHVTTLTESAVEALSFARNQRPGVGEAWILPAEHDPSQPVRRERLRDWWLEAEEAAKLEHIDGLGWHGLRRKFADDLRDLPLRDLAAAGGWKRTETITRCYQSPDHARIREAMEAR